MFPNSISQRFFFSWSHLTPALIIGPFFFLRAFSPPRLFTHLRPMPHMPLSSSLPPPNIDRPVPTTSGTPSPLASERTAHRGLKSVALQYTVWPCSASSWYIFRSPQSLLPTLIPPMMVTPNSQPPISSSAYRWAVAWNCVGSYSGPATSWGLVPTSPPQTTIPPVSPP